MESTDPSIFEGVEPADLVSILARLERRRFRAGEAIIREGAPPEQVAIIESGAAEIVMSDATGHEHLLGRLGPGDSAGEMGVFTDQPATATVRAVTPLDVLVMSRARFHEIAGDFPQVYRNIGVILAGRLARTNRLAVRVTHGRLTALLDAGAPPLLGYALACSVAWHTRGRILYLILTSDPPAGLSRLITPGNLPLSGDGAMPKRGLTVYVAAPQGAFAPGAIDAALERLTQQYDHLLVQSAVPLPLRGASRRVRLAGPGSTFFTETEGDIEYTLRASPETGTNARPNDGGVLCVPPFVAADERALTGGHLPPATTAGRALGWAARDLGGLKVGVALGGGAAKGYAHIGVLATLARQQIPVDFIAGSSIGAALATLHAMGHSPEQMANAMDDVGSAAFRLTLPLRSLLSSAGLRERIRKVCGEARIEQLQVPLALVAVDLPTRREIVFRRGLAWPALLASMAIPGIYPPLRMGQHLLVDGGVLNPVPANVAAGMGADIVIAVKLASRVNAPSVELEAMESAGRPPSLIQAITGAIDLMQSKITADTAARAPILIEPAFGPGDVMGLRNFSAGRRFIALGERAAEEALPRIAVALPWLEHGATGNGYD